MAFKNPLIAQPCSPDAERQNWAYMNQWFGKLQTRDGAKPLPLDTALVSGITMKQQAPDADRTTIYLNTNPLTPGGPENNQGLYWDNANSRFQFVSMASWPGLVTQDVLCPPVSIDGSGNLVFTTKTLTVPAKANATDTTLTTEAVDLLYDADYSTSTHAFTIDKKTIRQFKVTATSDAFKTVFTAEAC